MRQMTLSLIALLLLAAAPARADVLMWDLVAECQPGAKEVKLTNRYSVGQDATIDKLWACGGSCNAVRTLATPITWTHVGTNCFCFPSGQVSPDGNCPQNEYAKCTEVEEARLPYACDELAYTRICANAKCEPNSYFTGTDGPCATLQPAAGANQCLDPLVQGQAQVQITYPTGGERPTGELGDETGEGGCSISTGAANLSLLGLLLVAAVLGLVLSRRRK